MTSGASRVVGALALALVAAHASAANADAPPRVDVGRVTVVLPAGGWDVSDPRPASAGVTSSIQVIPGETRDLVLRTDPASMSHAALRVTVLLGLANVEFHEDCLPAAGAYVREFNHTTISTVVPYRCLRLAGPLAADTPELQRVVEKLRAMGHAVAPTYYTLDADMTNRAGSRVRVIGVISGDFTGLPGGRHARDGVLASSMPESVAAWADRVAEESDGALSSLFPKLRLPPIAFDSAPVVAARAASSSQE